MIEDYLITSEYVGETKHVHCYIVTNKKCEIKNSHMLDLSKEDLIIHGNYVSFKSSSSTIEYLLKNVNYKEDSEQILYSKNLNHQINIAGNFLTLDEAMLDLAKKGLIKEAMTLLENKNPTRYINSHASIEKSLRGIYLKSRGAVAKFNFSNYYLL